MRIALPVDDSSWETTVCQSFGRAPYFLIYDSAKDQHSFINNNAVSSRGGAGVKAAQLLVDSKVEALLTPRCGENAEGVLSSAGVRLFKTVDSSVKDTLRAFTQGKLAELKEINAGLHRHGGN